MVFVIHLSSLGHWQKLNCFPVLYMAAISDRHEKTKFKIQFVQDYLTSYYIMC